MRALRSCDFCGEQAVGTFEIVPEELDPTEAERRRAVLCASCKERLGTLIEPLLDHATDGQPNAESTSDTGVTEESPDDSGTDGGLIGAESGGPLLGGPDESESEPAPSDQTTAEDDEEGAADGQDSTAGSQTPDQDDSSRSQSRPDNYGKVLRLLRNREFPMTREEVVTIATSAYQLDARNVQTIIDESVERGEFVEANGRLERR